MTGLACVDTSEFMAEFTPKPKADGRGFFNNETQLFVLSQSAPALKQWRELSSAECTEITGSELAKLKKAVIEFYSASPEKIGDFDWENDTKLTMMEYMRKKLSIKAWRFQAKGAAPLVVLNGFSGKTPSFMAIADGGKINQFLSRHSLEQAVNFNGSLAFIVRGWEWESDNIWQCLVFDSPVAKPFICF
ncbi:MAG: hypothetical protein WC421_11025 [Elusimicrobiales bacterium]